MILHSKLYKCFFNWFVIFSADSFAVKMIPNTISRIMINTGNLISYKEFKKKATQSPSEEVFDSMSSTFNSYISTLQVDEIEGSYTVTCVNKDHNKAEKEERINLKVTVKIFLESFSCEELNSSVLQVMEELRIEVIDSLILSLPPLPSEEKFTLDHIKPLWTEIEKLVEENKVLTIGVSDLDTEELMQLYNWSQIKPGVNQVNLESCCVMPPEMTAFAQDHGIQLLTHNDPKVLLSRDMLQKIIEPAVSSPEMWKMNWIVRYSVVVKSRGIIQNKGYLLCAVKKNVN